MNPVWVLDQSQYPLAASHGITQNLKPGDPLGNTLSVCEVITRQEVTALCFLRPGGDDTAVRGGRGCVPREGRMFNKALDGSVNKRVACSPTDQNRFQ